MNESMASFILNKTLKVSFQPKSLLDCQRIKDDDRMVQYILENHKNGMFKKSLEDRPISSIERLINDEKKLIFILDEGGSSSSMDMKVEKSTGRDSNLKALKKRGIGENNVITSSWSSCSSNSSDDTEEDTLKVKKLLKEPDYATKSTKRTWWTPEQESFLIEKVEKLENEVGPRRELKTAKQMDDVIAEDFNDLFKTNRTGEQMMAKRKALMSRGERARSRGKKNLEIKKRAPPGNKMTAVEQAIMMIEKLSEKREQKREEREAQRRLEAREREDRIAALLLSLEKKENETLQLWDF